MHGRLAKAKHKSHHTIHPADRSHRKKKPQIEIFPDSFQIQQNINSIKSESLFITNIGADTLNYQISGNPNWLSFSQIQGNLLAQEQDSISLFFDTNGLNVDDYNDTIFIHSNDQILDSLSIPIKLMVNGVPQISFAPDSLDFGDIEVGKKDSVYLEISNIGTDTLEVGIFSNDSLCTLSQDSLHLVPNQLDSIFINFSPPDTGFFYDTLNLITNEGDSTKYEIPLRARGIGAFILAQSDTIIFGKIRVDSTKFLDFTIQNQGNSPLISRNFQITDSSFTSTADTFFIHPKDSNSISISFTPQQEGTISGEMLILSNAYNEDSLKIYLQGEGIIPNIWVEQDSLYFSAMVNQSVTKNLPIYNQGSDTLILFDISNNLSEFTLLSDTTFSISPDSMEQISIQFIPRDSIFYTDSLRIISNDPNESNLIVILHGRGKNSFDFGRLVKIIENWGLQESDESYNLVYDINKDGKIDVKDAQIYIHSWYDMK